MRYASTVGTYPPEGVPEQTGRKKALCIGINYLERSQAHAQLSGCIKDALRINGFLLNHWRSGGRGAIEIKILKDDSKKADQIPTRNNIVKAMRWLVKDALPGDSLFFHYSGHGGQIPDTNGDEDDGYDEVIYPVDPGSHILDDDMHDLMVKPLPPGCRLTVRRTSVYTLGMHLTSTLFYQAIFDASFEYTLNFRFALTA
ncbi:caspase domain-containing protein [Desarmillaria tabescens]|uniref:Caspase domain-containing protein n=1 Tax=Armillaria tabescens TaxID=1929756 RepID=A0AA39NB37_ARMTA|nr:caspase domain-containing protein [Desarmillaria tabescens]KAK0462339.1 caspase domain-containing protein [Desarmillaria tabescens]